MLLWGGGGTLYSEPESLFQSSAVAATHQHRLQRASFSFIFFPFVVGRRRGIVTKELPCFPSLRSGMMAYTLETHGPIPPPPPFSWRSANFRFSPARTQNTENHNNSIPTPGCRFSRLSRGHTFSQHCQILLQLKWSIIYMSESFLLFVLLHIF